MIQFSTAIINNDFYISADELARVVFNTQLEEQGAPCSSTKVQRDRVMAGLTEDITANLWAIHELPNGSGSVICTFKSLFAGRFAVSALVTHYGWSETISQPLLMALGEFGLLNAQRIQEEMTSHQINNEEAA